MKDWFMGLNPVSQAGLATLFTWSVTAAGAALVVFSQKISRRFLDASLGMAAGVMIAASFWSLLLPAIEMSQTAGSWYQKHSLAFLPALVGFIAGAAILRLIDVLLPHLHPGLRSPEGIKTSWQRSTLLVLAITIHNIPEGLAVGVAFGATAALSGTEKIAQMGAAVALAIGIGLQNFPEGSAVALPLRGEGMSRAKAFWYGQLSGFVEPVAGILGAWAVMSIAAVLPYALAFAAGAMIFVVVEELIPESQQHGHVDLATLGTIGGFAVMLTLDVALS